MEEKHIDIIRFCLNVVEVFGHEKSKSDIQETRVVFDRFIEENKNKKSCNCNGCRG